MRIRVIFDKYGPEKGLYTGWGVSFLAGESVLFDTGENGDWLLRNMRAMKIDLKKLKAVVISHDHWDHTGGLEALLKKQKGLAVYGCPGFSLNFKKMVEKTGADLIEDKEYREVTESIYTTGQIEGQYAGRYMPEQALIIKTERGMSVLTGCAHPGIVEMLESARRTFPGEGFYLVSGGFHLASESRQNIETVVAAFRRLGVKKAAATHCTGDEAEKAFEREYKTDFIRVVVGDTIEV